MAYPNERSRERERKSSAASAAIITLRRRPTPTRLDAAEVRFSSGTRTAAMFVIREIYFAIGIEYGNFENDEILLLAFLAKQRSI